MDPNKMWSMGKWRAQLKMMNFIMCETNKKKNLSESVG